MHKYRYLQYLSARKSSLELFSSRNITQKVNFDLKLVIFHTFAVSLPYFLTLKKVNFTPKLAAFWEHKLSKNTYFWYAIKKWYFWNLPALLRKLQPIKLTNLQAENYDKMSLKSLPTQRTPQPSKLCCGTQLYSLRVLEQADADYINPGYTFTWSFSAPF